MKQHETKPLSTEGALMAALLVHICLGAAAWYSFSAQQNDTSAYGNAASDIIAVEWVAAAAQEAPATSVATASATAPNTATAEPAPRRSTRAATSAPQAHSATAGGTPATTTRIHGSPHGSKVLRKIRTRLIRAQHYPPNARRQRLEGNPVVRFSIEQSGSVTGLTLVRSSGSPELDDAALQTVQRATPLPYYDEQITVPIRYVTHP